MIGGLALKTLKKLNGERFGLPFASMVLANAIGLGATALNKSPCNFPVEISVGINDAIKKIAFAKDNYYDIEQKTICRLNRTIILTILHYI
jgi:hypothetical protein